MHRELPPAGEHSHLDTCGVEHETKHWVLCSSSILTSAFLSWPVGRAISDFTHDAVTEVNYSARSSALVECYSCACGGGGGGQEYSRMKQLSLMIDRANTMAAQDTLTCIRMLLPTDYHESALLTPNSHTSTRIFRADGGTMEETRLSEPTNTFGSHRTDLRNPDGSSAGYL